MKPPLPTTNASRGRAPALTWVIRGLWLRLLAINLTFTKPLPLPHQSKGHQTLFCLNRNPLFQRTMIIQKWSQPRKRMKDCTSQASWRRLLVVMVISRLRWPVPCRPRRSTTRSASSANPETTL